MTAQHTPGPWGYDAESGTIYYADNHIEPQIAEVSLSNTDAEQAHSDGYLIAAAPDLLAALEAAVGYLDFHSTLQAEPYPLDRARAARAAIAKARGQ